MNELLISHRSCTQKIFLKKTLSGVCSPHLYASFGTSCFQIDYWFRNRRHFTFIAAICRFSDMLQRLTVPQIIDQFRRKMWQNKCKDVEYKLQKEFFQKYLLILHERWAVKNSFKVH